MLSDMPLAMAEPPYRRCAGAAARLLDQLPGETDRDALCREVPVEPGGRGRLRVAGEGLGHLELDGLTNQVGCQRQRERERRRLPLSDSDGVDVLGPGDAHAQLQLTQR